MGETIRSISNPRVKQWVSLSERKYRDREKKYIIEGIHLVQEALLSGAAIDAICYAEERGMPAEIAAMEQLAGVEVVAVTEEIVTRCTDTVTPQAVFAVVRKPEVSAADIVRQHASLVIVTDGVQDPGNLGTIIRSSDAVGASAVLLGKGTVDLYNPKTIRSTMGSLFHLPIAECELTELLPTAREQGIQVVASRLEQSQSCYETDFRGPTWLIIGNEGRGISDEVMRLADTFVRIPMPGKAESLNAAMAATILLFEAMRQRLQ